MAKDVITRFKLETTAYDSKLRDAAKGLADYTKTATTAGKEFGKFTQSNVEAARALGNITPSANNAKDKVKELVGAFNEAASAYNHLTKEQQQEDFAKAMAESLGKLKVQIAEAKQELYGMGDAMKNTGGKGGFLSGIGGKMSGSLQVFAGNMYTKAAEAVANLVSEMYGMVKQGVELAKQGEGIRIAFERLGRGDILDGLREATHGTVTDLELMKAAVKFNDFKLPLDELGTMLAFAQQKAKDTGQSVDYMVDSIVTGLGRKSLMILDNLGLSASEVKERMAETGDMTKAVGAIIRDQMSKAGDYVETAADRAAQANVNLQNKMEELGRKFAPVEEASNQLWTSMKIGILDVVGGPLARLLNGLTEAGRLRNQLNNMNGQEGSGNTKVDQQLKKLNVIRKRGSDYYFNTTLSGMVEDYNRQIMALDAQIKNGGKKPGGGSGESQNIRYLQEQMKVLQIMRDQLKTGAKELSKPVDVKIETKGAEQNIESLKLKLIELEAQRKKAIASGDTDLSKNLAKQINQVKADIKGLGGSTTTHKATPKTEMQQNQTRINDLTQQYVTLMAAASEAGKPLTDEQQKQTAEIQRQISELEKRNGQLKLYQEQAQGKLLGPDAFRQQLSVDVAVNNKKIEELEKQLISLNGITIDPKTVTITATDEALPKLREIQGITIDEKTMTVTADTQAALQALQAVEGVTIDPKTVTITATDEALPKLREIEGITIDEKTMTVTADTQAALQALQAVEGVTIDPKTVTITATDEALPKLREIQGITIDDKTMTVTANTQEALQALQGIDGVTIDTKNVKVTAETDEARQKVEELKRQIAELKDQNLMINAGMASLDLQNARDLSRTGGVTGFIGTGKSAMPVEGLPSMDEVVRQRGGNLLDEKGTKALNKEEKRNEKKEDKEQKSVVEGIDQLNGGINNIFGGLEQIGIEIPTELKSIFGVVQGVTTILMGIATTIIAIEALVGADTFLPFAKGGVVPKFAEGGLVPKFADGGLIGRAALGMTIPGNSYSGDNLRMPVIDSGGMIGVNSGEVILNRAQAGVIASDLQGGGMQNLKLDAVISGEQIRLVLNNNGRRTGRGEYVQSTRRRG